MLTEYDCRHVELKNLSEEEVEQISNWLAEEKHFEYDVDFTTLYAGAYRIVGIKFMNRQAFVATCEMLAQQ